MARPSSRWLSFSSVTVPAPEMRTWRSARAGSSMSTGPAALQPAAGDQLAAAQLQMRDRVGRAAHDDVAAVAGDQPQRHGSQNLDRVAAGPGQAAFGPGGGTSSSQERQPKRSSAIMVLRSRPPIAQASDRQTTPMPRPAEGDEAERAVHGRSPQAALLRSSSV